MAFKHCAAFLLAILLGMQGCDPSPKKENSNDQSRPTAVSGSASEVSSGQNKRAIRPPSAELAPDFTLTDIHGNEFKLSDYKGKVVVLDFWATWCPPCKAEIPFFIELENQYKKQGLAIIGLSVDSDVRKVKSFYKSQGINYPIAMANQEIATNYGGIQGIPTTFVIDRDGYIRDMYIGYRPKEVFEKAFLDLK